MILFFLVVVLSSSSIVPVQALDFNRFGEVSGVHVAGTRFDADGDQRIFVAVPIALPYCPVHVPVQLRNAYWDLQVMLG